MARPDDLRKSMEQSLASNPDDVATHMAYADLLVEQGDPRGELIQVQLALEDPSHRPADRRALQRCEKELLDAHQAEWLGEVADLFLTRGEAFRETARRFWLEVYEDDDYKVTFARGWVDTLDLDRISAAFAEALGRCPTLALLRQLIIRGGYIDTGYFEMTEWAALTNVRRFQFGDENNPSHAGGSGIVAPVAQMKRLEELALYARGVDVEELFALELPCLRALTVHHLHSYPLGVLAHNASMGNLTTLRCWPHALEPEDEEAYIRPEGFVALMQSPHLRSLTHLELYLTDIGDEEMLALVESGKLKQLRVLDLWNSRVSNAGARVLAACPDLPRLDLLRLAQNQLTEWGIRALRATGVRLDAERQYREHQIARNDHLWEGDCE